MSHEKIKINGHKGVIDIVSLITLLLKKILIKSAEKAVQIAQSQAIKSSKKMLGNNKALQHLNKIKKIMHISSIISVIFDFGLIVTGIVVVIMVFVVIASSAGATKANCAENTSDSDQVISAPSGNSNSSKNFTLADISKFGDEGIQSDWGLTDSQVENLFLATNRSVAAKYSLTKENIHSVSLAISSVGVSPEFFWLYAINEGGGAGGFINHYAASHDSNNAQLDALRDAQYLVQEANNNSDGVATGGGEPSDMPTSEASSWFHSRHEGSIGIIYIQATSAVTAEIETLFGNTGTWTGKFGNPLSDMMNHINSMGGDWTNGAQAVVNGGSDSSESAHNSDDYAVEDDCSTDINSVGSIPSGGMKLQQAQNWMNGTYKTAKLPGDYFGEAQGTPDSHDNCTVFSGWFVSTFTDLKWRSGNGAEIVSKLSASNKINISEKPELYAIYSIAPGKSSGCGWTTSVPEGHTGVILGIDGKNAIVGQAGYGQDYINASSVPLDEMTQANGWTFFSTKNHLKTLPKN
jgi:hypothetical protein